MPFFFVRPEPPGKVADLVVAPWDSLVVPLGSAPSGANAWACCVGTNPLRPPGGGLRWPTPIDDVNCPPIVVAWSGTIAEGFFERDPRSWSAESRQRFETVCSRAHERLVRTGRRLLFRPCSRHVLNDAPSALAFLRAREGQPFGIVFDPAALLEPEMITRKGDRAADHVTRAFEALGGLSEAVWICGAHVDEDDGRVAPCALRDSAVPASLFAKLIRNCCPRDAVIVLCGPTPDEDAQILRAEGVAV